jgi:release factor glutamine methyltransferase
MTPHFAARAVESPRLVAEMLLAHVLGCERLRLYMEVDRPATPLELASLRELVTRAARHEPVQYLTGSAWFFSRQFDVNPSTLIPRPSTETLVEHILQWHRTALGAGNPPAHAAPLIADIGTGTGCIAISLAAQISDARIIATDTQPAALELAAKNALRHDVDDRIEFRVGSGVDPLVQRPGSGGSSRFDVIASNPPYIPDHEWEAVAANVKNYEPAAALRGGVDGLDVIRPLIEHAGPLLKPGGQLVVEIADCQKEQVMELVRMAGDYEEPRVLKDHEGLWRVLVAPRGDRSMRDRRSDG